MLFPLEAARRTDHGTVSKTHDYDVVIVGTGILVPLLQSRRRKPEMRVLILEAGDGSNRSLEGYNDLLTTFYSAATKDNQSPFPLNANAPMPRGPQLRKLQPGETDSSTYIVQSGPYVTDTTYTRIFGGTTMHWEAKTPRMLRSDFQSRTNFGRVWTGLEL